MILRYLSLFVGVLLFSLVSSCNGPAPSTSTPAEPTSNERSIDDASAEAPAEPSLAAPESTVEGDILDGNRVWLPSADVLAVIKAGEAADGFGPSHRTLQLLDGRTCETKFETTIHDNSSPD